MKYMTFNSSCAFAGVANMLESFGVDVDDRTIALGMGLPYLFRKEENGTYLAGPMLQSAFWFNRYLNTIGFHMQETALPRCDVPQALLHGNCAMLGLHLNGYGKHAVVYTGMKGNRFCFLNNQWQHESTPSHVQLTKDELLVHLDSSVVLATLHALGAPCQLSDDPAIFTESCRVLATMKRDLSVFCAVTQTHAAISSAMNRLFRAILLDGVTMLELARQEVLAKTLRALQSQLLAAFRAQKTVVLSDMLNLPALLDAVDAYAAWISTETGCDLPSL